MFPSLCRIPLSYPNSSRHCKAAAGLAADFLCSCPANVPKHAIRPEKTPSVMHHFPVVLGFSAVDHMHAWIPLGPGSHLKGTWSLLS